MKCLSEFINRFFEWSFQRTEDRISRKTRRTNERRSINRKQNSQVWRRGWMAAKETKAKPGQFVLCKSGATGIRC